MGAKNKDQEEKELARVAQDSETGTCPKSSGPGPWDPAPGLTWSHLSLSRLGEGVVEHKVWSSQGWGCLGGPPAHVTSKCLLTRCPCTMPPSSVCRLGRHSMFYSTESPHCKSYQLEGLEINSQESSVMFESYGPHIPFDTSEHTRSETPPPRQPLPGMRPPLNHLFQGVLFSGYPRCECSPRFRITGSSSHRIFPVMSN